MSTPARFAAAADQVVQNSITYLEFRGIINQTFGGGKLAPMVRTKKLILDLREVTRISSSGMAAWLAFLRANSTKEILIVECSAYVMNQFNQVAGLFGTAKVISFYAPYRCSPCDNEFFALVLVPRDRVAIRDRGLTEHSCPSCGASAELDDDPTSFFSTVAQQPLVDLDDEVETFLQTQLKYDLTPDKTRFRGGFVRKSDLTYLRLTGRIDRSLPQESLTKSVEGTAALVDVSELVLADSGGIAQWRMVVRTALATAVSLELVGCPPGFLEAAVLPEDLGDKFNIHSFAMPCRCVKCNATSNTMIRVRDHYAKLAASMALDLGNCETCHTPLTATPSDSLRALLRAIPRQEPDPRVAKFIIKCQKLSFARLANCLSAGEQTAKVPVALLRVGYLLIALAVAVLSAEAIIAYRLSTREPTEVAGGGNPTPKEPSFERPSWIVSGIPASAYCHDLINRLMCVGVSSHRANRDEAVTEAIDAALDELTQNIGLKITDPFFQRNVVPVYQDTRAQALSALEPTENVPDAKTAKAYETVWKARKRVTGALKVSGGAAVPSQYSDWYWEEYKSLKGEGTEFLVFVRYDINIDAMKALVERYTTSIELPKASTVSTAFPGLAWKYPDFTGGAMLRTVAKRFAGAGLVEGNIVVAVGDKPVQNADDLVKLLKTISEGLKLNVKAGDTPIKTVEVP